MSAMTKIQSQIVKAIETAFGATNVALSPSIIDRFGAAVGEASVPAEKDRAGRRIQWEVMSTGDTEFVVSLDKSGRSTLTVHLLVKDGKVTLFLPSAGEVKPSAGDLDVGVFAVEATGLFSDDEMISVVGGLLKLVDGPGKGAKKSAKKSAKGAGEEV